MSEKIGRREATRRALTVIGAAALGAPLLGGCGEEGNDNLTCTDTAGLTPAQIEVRTSQHYTDASSTAGESCSTCRFFTAGQSGACGSCQVVGGPIHPDGNCDLFAAQS